MTDKTPIRFRDARLKRADSSERDRSLFVLQLSARATHCLHYLSITTVGELIDAARHGIAWVRQIGAVTRADIEEALRSLATCIGAHGVVNWDTYYRIRGVDAPAPSAPARRVPRPDVAVSFSSESFARLLPSYREVPLGILHLGTRAQTSLARIRVRSIGALIDAARHGVPELRAAGKRTVVEIREALCALSGAVRSDGSVDWIAYASARDFVILPARDCDVFSPREFIRIFPGLAKQAARSRYGSLEFAVLRASLLYSGKRRTLEKVGDQLQCTKAAVSLVVHKLLSMFRRSMLHDDYGGCRFRFRYGFVAPLRKLHVALSPRKHLPLLYSDWEQIILREWAVTPAEIIPLRRFLLDILDIRLVGPHAERFQQILLPKGEDTRGFAPGARAAERLLRFHFPNGLSEPKLRGMLRQRLRYPFSRREVVAIAKSISGVERVGAEGRFRMRAGRLLRVRDQIERLLREKGAPMHISEVAAELARIRSESPRRRNVRTVSSSLNGCKRFKPIGRTGYWALKEWTHIEARSIPDMVFDILRKSKSPMTSAQLYPLVAARRNVAPKSISRMLLEDRRFRRSGPLAWKLA